MYMYQQLIPVHLLGMHVTTILCVVPTWAQHKIPGLNLGGVSVAGALPLLPLGSWSPTLRVATILLSYQEASNSNILFIEHFFDSKLQTTFSFA